jgi:hypothetical protein
MADPAKLEYLKADRADRADLSKCLGPDVALPKKSSANCPYFLGKEEPRSSAVFVSRTSPERCQDADSADVFSNSGDKIMATKC